MNNFCIGMMPQEKTFCYHEYDIWDVDGDGETDKVRVFFNVDNSADRLLEVGPIQVLTSSGLPEGVLPDCVYNQEGETFTLNDDTDFDNYSQEEIRAIEAYLNNRPKKCLGYYTPNEILNTLSLVVH